MCYMLCAMCCVLSCDICYVFFVSCVDFGLLFFDLDFELELRELT